MFTPGFLLVDDEVNGVRVESADNGDLYEIDDKDGNDVEDSTIKIYKDETSNVDSIEYYYFFINALSSKVLLRPIIYN